MECKPIHESGGEAPHRGHEAKPREAEGFVFFFVSGVHILQYFAVVQDNIRSLPFRHAETMSYSRLSIPPDNYRAK